MKLDEQQNLAVKSNAKNIIVAAGAGSGKTRVIVERIRWLLTTGARPNSIVAITFTNMAAQEMRARLKDIPRTGDMFIGTIHSFANQILRNSGKPYEIFNEQIQNSFMMYLCKRYGKHLVFDRYLQYMDVKKSIDLGFADTGALQQFTSGERFELDMFLGKREIKKTDEEYPVNIWKLCKNRNVITFDELLKLSGAYFNSLGTGGIAHLMVDELQDIGHLEYDFLRKLRADNNFFVGDDWQAIYGFKGGNVKIFKSLIEDENWQRIDLVNNYRCGNNIIMAANDIIGQCDDIVSKNIVALADYEGNVKVDTKFHLEKYLQEVADMAAAQECNLRDWFVLVRSNKDLMEVSQRMDVLGIPHETFKKSDLSFAELQDIMSSSTIKLLTVHMAKGLEAENVIMWGPFPVHPPVYLVNKEERRVMYVAMTRAKKQLIILK